MQQVKAFQDRYPDDVAHCYGCGRLNEAGHHIRTSWEGDESVTRFTPGAIHTAMPGTVYGGMIAMLIDCHSTGTAAAAAARAAGNDDGEGPLPRFVTASLRVDYRRPTPLGPVLEIRGRVKEIKGRKVVVESRLLASGEVCATGEVVAVAMPDGFTPR